MERNVRIFISILLFLFFMISSCTTDKKEDPSPVKKSTDNYKKYELPGKPLLPFFNEKLKISEEEKQKILSDWENEKKKFLAEKDKNDWKKDIPKTLPEGMKRLDKMMSEGNKELFRNATEDDAIDLHFGMGMGLRNSWGLWAKSDIYYYLYARGIEHPDSMSNYIIESYIKHLQGKEYRKQAEIEHPEYFQMTDAITSGNNDKFTELTNKFKELPKSTIIKNVTPVDLAIQTCNDFALTKLLEAGAKIIDRKKDCIEYRKHFKNSECYEESYTLSDAAECGHKVLQILTDNDPSFIKKKEFFKTLSKKKNLIYKYCKHLPEMDKKKTKELLLNTAKSGSINDVKCVASKLDESDIKFPIIMLAEKDISPEKKQFISKHIDPKKPNKNILIETIEDLARFADGKTLINTIKSYGLTPNDFKESYIYSHIMVNKDVNTLKDLLDFGLYLSSSEDNNFFTKAVHTCNPLAVDFLIESGIDINLKNEKNRLVIFELIYNGCRYDGNRKVFMKYLILRGVDVSGIKAEDEIITMSSKGNLELIKFFISAGADLKKLKENEKNNRKTSLLHASIYSNNPEMFEFILNGGDYNIEHKGHCGKTSMHYAADLNHSKILKKLISLGADINVKTEKDCELHNTFYSESTGNTPLMSALIGYGFGSPSFETVKLLVENGADISIKNNSGQTALGIAKSMLIIEEDNKASLEKDNRKPYNLGKIKRLKKIIKYLELKEKEGITSQADKR